MKKILMAFTAAFLMGVTGVFAMSSGEGSTGTFEIVNKNDAPIWISLINGNELIFNSAQVSSKEISNPIDTNKDTILYLKDKAIKGGPVFVYEFTKGKNILVAYNSEREAFRDYNKLTPQTSSLKGRISKIKSGNLRNLRENVTRSGISLRNNVTQSDIKKVSDWRKKSVLLDKFSLMAPLANIKIKQEQ